MKTIPYWYPTDPFGPDREMWRGGHRDAGITRVCDFYTKRNLWALAALWANVSEAISFPGDSYREARLSYGQSRFGELLQ